ncbi:MAG: hypothetical protein KF813_02720 [Trueperaceae bacterium]|nr:hypothetical protein [Trueperaceae bacterium]
MVWANAYLKRALTVSTLAIAALALAQTVTTFTLQREDTDLIVSNRALAADGARSIGNNVNCEEDTRMTIVYGPAPGHVETRVEDAILTSSLALIRSPRETGEEGEQDSLELLDAAVAFSRPGCPETVTPAEVPRVTLSQGRTNVDGTRFFLDRGENVGHMEGPIRLTRAGEDGTTALEASAESMEFEVGEQRATLSGAVTVTSDERTTTGDSLELDEAAGTAILRGEPARSTKGSDTLQGRVLLYYLDSDDVVVIGNVSGSIEIDLQ